MNHITAVKYAELSYRPSGSTTEKAWSSYVLGILRSLGVEASTFTVDDHEGFIAGDSITFRGSDRVPDWVTNVTPAVVNWPARPGDPITTHGAAAHGGYLMAVERILPEVLTPLTALGRPLHFVGHSKGAALAMIAALRCVDHGLKVASVTTFGGPRCLNFVAAKQLETLATVRRYVNTWDPVPQAWWTTGLTHCGSEHYRDRDRALRVDPGFGWKMWDRWVAYLRNGDTVGQVHSIRSYRRILQDIERGVPCGW